MRKILMVDFVDKKITAAYEGPSGQTFIPLTNTTEHVDFKRLMEYNKRIDRILQSLAELKQKGSNNNGD